MNIEANKNVLLVALLLFVFLVVAAWFPGFVEDLIAFTANIIFYLIQYMKWKKQEGESGDGAIVETTPAVEAVAVETPAVDAPAVEATPDTPGWRASINSFLNNVNQRIPMIIGGFIMLVLVIGLLTRLSSGQTASSEEDEGEFNFPTAVLETGNPTVVFTPATEDSTEATTGPPATPSADDSQCRVVDHDTATLRTCTVKVNCPNKLAEIPADDPIEFLGETKAGTFAGTSGSLLWLKVKWNELIGYVHVDWTKNCTQ